MLPDFLCTHSLYVDRRCVMDNGKKTVAVVSNHENCLDYKLLEWLESIALCVSYLKPEMLSDSAHQRSCYLILLKWDAFSKEILHWIHEFDVAPVLFFLPANVEIAEIIRMGIDDFIIKPYDESELFARIMNMLVRPGQKHLLFYAIKASHD